MYNDRGAFAEYLKIKGGLAWKIPQVVKDEDATTYGVSTVLGLSPFLLVFILFNLLFNKYITS